jgi:hypothetical protein
MKELNGLKVQSGSMRRAGLVLAFAALWISTPARAAPAREWSPAVAPLLTRWARYVSPERARPEYPRPQMVRQEWLNLNGLWQFAFDDQNAGRQAGWSSGKPLPMRILVPFTFEAALSGIGRGSEVHERVWYRRTFTVPPAWRREPFQGGRVLIHFDAVDWEATVWVNGRELGSHRGGYSPFTVDVTPALRPRGQQELVIAVYDPADPAQGAYQPKGKQLGSHGIFYTRTTGIWQTVWLESVARSYISDLELGADPRTQEVTVRAYVVARNIPRGQIQSVTGLRLTVLQPGGKIAATSTSHTVAAWAVPLDNTSLIERPKPAPAESVAGDKRGRPFYRVTAIVPHARPWTPESPILYQLRLELLEGATVVDRVASYAGFRSVGTREGRLTMNGKPYFYRGVLDQGYWPGGILTPPSDAAIRAEVEMTKALGFNCARKHVKVEDPRWYYWCDRLGLAVWQDMPSSHNLGSEEAKENFRRELTEMVEDLRDHPSVVQWIAFNENWGNPGEFQDQMVAQTRELDSSRPITDASGWTQRGLTDVIDVHDYGNNLVRQGVDQPAKPKVVGEFGGIALHVPGHTWTKGWGYQTVHTPEELLRRLRYLVTQLYGAHNLSGFVYTQLTDVEQEQNGLLTYDRLPKARPARVAAIVTGRDRTPAGEALQSGFLTDWWVLGPIAIEGRITSAQPNAENKRLMGAALDRAWVPSEGLLKPRESGMVTVGNRVLGWKHVRAEEDTLDLIQALGQTEDAVAYTVAEFEAPQAVSGLKLRFGSDDAAKVWLNGKLIWTINTTRGVTVDEDEIRGVSLRAGRNVLVVKVVQGVGGWGLAARFVRVDGSPFLVRSEGSGG